MTAIISSEARIRQALVTSYYEGLFAFTRDNTSFQAMINGVESKYKQMFEEEIKRLGVNHNSLIDSTASSHYSPVKDLFDNKEKFKAFIMSHYSKKFKSPLSFKASIEVDLHPLAKYIADPKSIQSVIASGKQFMSTLHNSDVVVRQLEKMVNDSNDLQLTDEVINQATRAVHDSGFVYERIQEIQQEMLTPYLVSLYSVPVSNEKVQLWLTNQLIATKIWEQHKLVVSYAKHRAAEIYRT